MAKTYADFPLFGGRPINPGLMGPINEWAAEVNDHDPGIWPVLKSHVTQGAGSAGASKGTHKKGWCIDFKSRGLANDTVRRMVNALNIHNSRYFAAVLRLPGEAGASEHIHAAFHNRENYLRVLALIGPDGPNYIEKKLAKRK